ncbi:hypothetical protein EXN66_Car008772 [Channa argus]|uniref:Uncharacterized protein n=1 Tax=Channa argus TaxID=215402 RepID=A0A6G1PSY1_CHAAH|nr:hypothetical protein EXN66_Car008772 [Channa argus]
MLSKLLSVLDNPSHRLRCVLAAQSSTFSQRLITVKSSTEQHRSSSLPVAIKLFKSSPFFKKDGD